MQGHLGIHAWCRVTEALGHDGRSCRGVHAAFVSAGHLPQYMSSPEIGGGPGPAADQHGQPPRVRANGAT